MPIKLTYKELNNLNLGKALKKLRDFEGFRGQLKYNVTKIARKFDEEIQIATQAYVDIVKKCAIKDEKGAVLPGEGGKGFNISADKIEEFETEMKAFDATEIEIPVHHIRMDQLEEVPLSPNDLLVLDPFVVEMEAVSEEIKTPQSA